MRLLIGSSILLLATIILLRLAHVPLGEPGRTVYGYSGLAADRLLSDTWPIMPIAATIALGIWWLDDPRRIRHYLASAAIVFGIVGLLIWTYASPPLAVEQHLLNFHSPGQDGAFLIESHSAPDARTYLQFFTERLKLSPHEAGSTRMLSNPPGMTLLAFISNVIPLPGHGAVERWMLGDEDLAQREALSSALRFSLMLTFLWGLSAIFCYQLGRLFLSPIAAVALTVTVTFNPCTVHFVPGKDPAQLLTINAMLWTYLTACKSDGWRSCLFAFSSGVLLTIGATCGLIHLWIAAAVLAATIWSGGWRSVLRPMIVAAVGILVTLIVIRCTLGWNASRGLWEVYQRFGEIQPIIYPHRGLWLLIGLPIFLLFLSPGVVVPTWRALGHINGRSPFGRSLLLSTLGVMAITYFFGVSYELPRLWVAFIPSLTLGAMSACPLFSSSSHASSHARPAILALALTQIFFTAIHFSMLDARGSEQRITSGRMFSVVNFAAARASR